MKKPLVEKICENLVGKARACDHSSLHPWLGEETPLWKATAKDTGMLNGMAPQLPGRGLSCWRNRTAAFLILPQLSTADSKGWVRAAKTWLAFHWPTGTETVA